MYVSRKPCYNLQFFYFNFFHASSNNLFWVNFFFRNSHNKSAIILIVSNGILALSIILVDLIPQASTISTVLFGNILSVSLDDLIILFILVFIVIVLLYINFRKLILMSLNKEFAIIMKFYPELIEVIFLVILSTTIMIVLKIFGGILLTALLIIPPTTARMLSNSATGMVIYSNILSSILNISGVGISFCFNIPTTATIVLINFIAFTCVFLISNLRRHRH